jgi:AraC-like DNA-binding protein
MPREVRVDARIRIILRIVDEQEGTGQLASREAGRLLGLSDAYFLRLFHREVRTTFGRYLREVRMARAAESVKDHTLSIKRIALDSGYSDVSNFYRDFKQVCGMNPGQIRVRHLILSQEGGVAIHSLVSALGHTNP